MSLMIMRSGAGAPQCVDGAIQCVSTILQEEEICNGIDDNCDGVYVD